MNNLLENAGKNIKYFGNYDVTKTPPLKESYNYAAHNIERVFRSFATYHIIIKHVFTLTDQELNTIRQVNEALHKPRGVHEFIEHMGPHKEKILTIVRHAGNRDLPSNRMGVDQLAKMMTNAWKLKISDPNWKPIDGDPRADNVIWGFVNGSVDPSTNIDFALCHGIERITTAYLKEKGVQDEYINHKDWLLCGMNDVIALRGSQGKYPEKNVLDLWTQKRPNGLGWISQDRLNAYKKLLSKTS